MNLGGTARAQKINASFRAQYADLDEETLRQIAGGKVPWAQDGAYLFQARRAARTILLERGLPNVPAVPAWDPSAVEAPGWIRAIVLGLGLLVTLGGAAAYGFLAPVDAVNEESACGELQTALSTFGPAQRHELRVDGCSLEAGVAGQIETTHPLRVLGCVTLTEANLTALKRDRDRVSIGFVRAFAATPSPGEHCGEVPLADVVVRRGRPWFVRFR